MRRTDISATSQLPTARKITAQVSQVIHYPDHYRPAEVLGRIEDLLESLPLATTDHDLSYCSHPHRPPLLFSRRNGGGHI